MIRNISAILNEQTDARDLMYSDHKLVLSRWARVL